MKPLTVILSLSASLALSACAELNTLSKHTLGIDFQAANYCAVVGVHDGDSITCLYNGREQVKIRLNQIDAPELGQPFSQKSRDKLSEMTYAQYVNIEQSGKDKYGRTIAEVYLQDGTNVNLEMVKSGMAWAYTEYATNPEYARAQESAKQQGLGIWSQPDPIYPSDWRKGIRPADVKNPIYSDKPAAARKLSKQTRQNSSAALSKSAAFKCGAKRLCSQMTSCKEARYYLNQCGVRRLDRDGDGTPCESLC